MCAFKSSILRCQSYFFLFLILQLRQQEKWFIVHELHLTTSESRTCPECHRSRAEGWGDCFGYNKGSQVSQVVSVSRWWCSRSTETYIDTVPKTCTIALAFGIPYFCSFSLRGCTNWFTWTSASAFFSCTSACASFSSSTWLMAQEFPGRWR